MYMHTQKVPRTEILYLSEKGFVGERHSGWPWKLNEVCTRGKKDEHLRQRHCEWRCRGVARRASMKNGVVQSCQSTELVKSFQVLPSDWGGRKKYTDESKDRAPWGPETCHLAKVLFEIFEPISKIRYHIKIQISFFLSFKFYLFFTQQVLISYLFYTY